MFIHLFTISFPKSGYMSYFHARQFALQFATTKNLHIKYFFFFIRLDLRDLYLEPLLGFVFRIFIQNFNEKIISMDCIVLCCEWQCERKKKINKTIWSSTKLKTFCAQKRFFFFWTAQLIFNWLWRRLRFRLGTTRNAYNRNADLHRINICIIPYSIRICGIYHTYIVHVQYIGRERESLTRRCDIYTWCIVIIWCDVNGIVNNYALQMLVKFIGKLCLCLYIYILSYHTQTYMYIWLWWWCTYNKYKYILRIFIYVVLIAIIM